MLYHAQLSPCVAMAFTTKRPIPRSGEAIHGEALPANGDLDAAMEALARSQIPLPEHLYLALLRDCCKAKALPRAQRVCAHILRHHRRKPPSAFLGDFLAMAMAKCGAVSDALRISQALPARTVFSWTAIIAAFAENGCGIEALRAYGGMLEDGIEPSSYTFVSLLRACGDACDLPRGRRFHEEAWEREVSGDAFVANALVSMYGRCGAVSDAEAVFFGAISKQQGDLVSWNSMLSAYVENDEGRIALRLFRQMMQEEGHRAPSKPTIVLALKACSAAERSSAGSTMMEMGYEIGQALHALACRRLGLGRSSDDDGSIGTALVHMYGRCGAVGEAENAFAALPRRDVVAWTALLSAYVEQGRGRCALLAFRQMHEDGVEPNRLTFGIALQACHALVNEVSIGEGEAEQREPSSRGSWSSSPIEIGRALHADAIKRGYTSDSIVGNPLISMYCKCSGRVEEAERVFGALVYRDIPSWNAMLSAYVERGESAKALELYKRMEEEKVSLNELTIVGILQACSETGSSDVCKQVHFAIAGSAAGLDMITSLMATLVHSYGSCACMADAGMVFDTLVHDSIVAWNAVIAGHAREGDYIASECVFEGMKRRGIDPDEVTFTSLLSLCSHSGLVYTGLEHFAAMRSEYGMIPDPKLYGIIVDLVGRAGDFKTLEGVLSNIPRKADLAAIWLSVLNACRIHGNSGVAKEAFGHVMNLGPKKGSAYVLMSNIYADDEPYGSAME